MQSSQPDRYVTGVILAGGRSRRMGGGDKGLLAIGGRSMLAHVVARFAPQVSRLALNANGDPTRFAELGLPVIADAAEDFAGPLAGLLAAMEWSAKVAPDVHFIASVPADVPFLPEMLVARLAEAVVDRADRPALAASGGQLHPVIGLWPVALAGDIAAALRQDDNAMHRFAARHDSVKVEFPFIDIRGRRVDPFFNANTQKDFDDIRALLEG